MERPARARLGEHLVRQGLLTEAEVQIALGIQHRTGEPFGVLAERLFDLTPGEVERAWVEQYLSYGTRINLDDANTDPASLRYLTTRQAWQFALLPIGREDGLLTMATCEQRLPAAAAFVWRRMREPVYLVVATAEQLHRHLMQRYPWPAMRDADLRQRHTMLVRSDAQAAV